ncbi:MAG: Ada metal-binding domain-containing protein [Candidatus Zixiibacteriota bacterium]
MTRLSYKKMVSEMSANNAAYDGKFYVGVISTGIYCLPSCKAKLPLLKNVVFFDSREEAIASGLRGCKRCRSESFPDVLPQWLHDVLTYMNQHRTARLNERQLSDLTGVNITTVRRYFKRHLGITPLSFHRIVRLNYARQMLEEGQDFLAAAFEAGWESASGFREAFRKHFGCPPGRINQ